MGENERENEERKKGKEKKERQEKKGRKKEKKFDWNKKGIKSWLKSSDWNERVNKIKS